MKPLDVVMKSSKHEPLVLLCSVRNVSTPKTNQQNHFNHRNKHSVPEGVKSALMSMSVSVSMTVSVIKRDIGKRMAVVIAPLTNIQRSITSRIIAFSAVTTVSLMKTKPVTMTVHTLSSLSLSLQFALKRVRRVIISVIN
jgi:hypothetical protein